MKKIVFTLIILFNIIFLFSCKENKKEQKTIKKYYTVTAKTHNEELFFSGELAPIREAAVTAPMQATITKMHFNYGQIVKKGQVLIELDSPEQKKEYDETLTGFLKAKDQLEISKAKFSGTESLWKEGLVPENTYKSDKSALFTNKIAFIQSRTKLITLIKKISSHQDLEFESLSFDDFNKIQSLLNEEKNKIILTAPYSGIALEAKSTDHDKASLRVGSQIKASEVITLIGDISGLLINIKVPEVNIDKIKPGMKAIVTGIAFPNIELTATVEGVNSQASSASGASGGLPLFSARIVVPNLTNEQQKRIKVGMSAMVKVIQQSKKLIMVPIAAINQVNGKNIVNIKGQDGKVSPVEISTGEATADKVVVLKGLKIGDVITWQINQ